MEIVKQSLDAIIKKTVRYLILNLDLRNFFYRIQGFLDWYTKVYVMIIKENLNVNVRTR